MNRRKFIGAAGVAVSASVLPVTAKVFPVVPWNPEPEKEEEYNYYATYWNEKKGQRRYKIHKEMFDLWKRRAENGTGGTRLYKFNSNFIHKVYETSFGNKYGASSFYRVSRSTELPVSLDMTIVPYIELPESFVSWLARD